MARRILHLVADFLDTGSLVGMDQVIILSDVLTDPDDATGSNRIR